MAAFASFRMQFAHGRPLWEALLLYNPFTCLRFLAVLKNVMDVITLGTGYRISSDSPKRRSLNGFIVNSWTFSTKPAAVVVKRRCCRLRCSILC